MPLAQIQVTIVKGKIQGIPAEHVIPQHYKGCPNTGKKVPSNQDKPIIWGGCASMYYQCRGCWKGHSWRFKIVDKVAEND